MDKVNYMPTDTQFRAQLIDNYYVFLELYEIAMKENAIETAHAIRIKMECTRSKLQQAEIPEIPEMPL